MNFPGVNCLILVNHIVTSVLPRRVWFLRRFGLKTVIDFVRFGLQLGMVRGNYGIECSVFVVSIPNEQDRKSNLQIRKWISKYWSSNLSNVDIQFLPMWVWILEARSENGGGKWHFCSETGSGFGETGGTPHRELPGVPPPPECIYIGYYSYLFKC